VTFPTRKEPKLAVVIPAKDEEAVLGRTLRLIDAARARYTADLGETVEVIVAVNGSTDRSVEIAAATGARVLDLPAANIPAARNAGARATSADWLIFLDADTELGDELLISVHKALAGGRCIGGAPTAVYDYEKRSLWLYMQLWRLVAMRLKMTQGVCQFCTAAAFEAVGGYPSDLRMAEDTEFYRRLRTYARWQGDHVEVIEETVIASSRRLDQWPVWKTILLTNPITTRLFLRSAWLWKSWTDGSVR
jgi:glycosyltransferase involved in cell wall biosynthesis